MYINAAILMRIVILPSLNSSMYNMSVVFICDCLSEGGSTTDSDDYEEDEGSTNPPSTSNSAFYTSLADDHAASLLLNSEQGNV